MAKDRSILVGLFGFMLCMMGLVSLMLFSGCGTITPAPSSYVSGWATGGGLPDGWGYILHTSDSGQTWVRQGDSSQLAGIRINDISAVSAQIAWACGYYGNVDDPHFLDPVIIKTIDGGTTWQFQSLPAGTTGKELDKIKAVDQDVVWAAGYHGLILRTVDGGTTWIDRSYPSNEAHVSSIAPKDANHAFAGGSLEQSQLLLAVYTNDGGQTWLQPDSRPEDWGIIIETYWVPNSSTIWAVGQAVDISGVIMVSNNSGISWESKIDPIGLSHTNAVFAITPERVWVGADHGNIRYSIDGGTIWDAPTPPINIWSGGVCAVSADEIWMAGFTEGSSQRGYIIHSTNGGVSWEAQNAPSSEALWRISMVR